MYASLSPGDQLKVDRTLGRRVVDVKRLASLLPKVAKAANDSTPDRVAGVSSVGERRITGVSWMHGRAVPTGRLSVGGEIDAWCGKCGEITNHHIVALVGSDPKQVLCQVCNSRHAYRTAAARRSSAEEAPAGVSESRPRGVDPEAAKRAAQLRELARGSRTPPSRSSRFDPKQRYRVGDIISHPEYGRGKIESVLRSSLLVRFAIGGLKSLMLT